MKFFIIVFVLWSFMTCISAIAETKPITDQDKTASSVQPFRPRAIGKPHTCNAYRSDDLPEGFRGATTLRFHITPKGTVTDITIEKSSGYEALDNAAIACVSTWQYEPIVQNGEPVEVSWVAETEWHRGQGPAPIVEQYSELRAQCLRLFPVTADQAITGSGITELALWISGGVIHGKIARSSGNAVLDQHAIACVKSWDVSNMAGALPPFEVQWRQTSSPEKQ